MLVGEVWSEVCYYVTCWVRLGSERHHPRFGRVVALEPNHQMTPRCAARNAGVKLRIRFVIDEHVGGRIGATQMPIDRAAHQRALHRLAVNKGRWDPQSADYLARKQAEGKTRREALRCLKRHLVRVVFRLLRQSSSARPELVLKVRGGKVRVPALA